MAQTAREDLIGRLEKATGPDRAIDWQIHVADGLEGAGMYGSHPLYTASIDAALTLIPKDYRLELKGVNDSWDAFLNDTRHAKRGDDTHGRGPTPAIATCIAALRAQDNHPTPTDQ